MTLRPIKWQAWVRGDTDCEKPLLVALARVARARGRGWHIYVTFGRRSYAEQTALYRANMNPRTGTPYPGHPLTARPGTSRHETGKAADVQIVDPKGRSRNIGDDAEARRLMRKFGLCLPVPGESWHVERGRTWRA